MRCRICGKDAKIKLKRHNIKLCNNCFENFFIHQIQHTVEKYKLLKENEKLAVAVSGGKDSITLLYAMHSLGFKPLAYFIDLGIPKYSAYSRAVVETFCDELGIKLHVEELLAYNKTLPQILEKTKRVSCSLCGSIKRYLMNKFAFENGYVIATGHHLDDMLVGIFSNLANANINGLSKFLPRLEYSEEFKLAAKIKPFYRTSEDEILLFHNLKNLPKVNYMCPFAVDANSLKLKEWFSKLDLFVPNMRFNFYFNFVSKILPKLVSQKPEYNKCKHCGFPTGRNRDYCTFCVYIYGMK